MQKLSKRLLAESGGGGAAKAWAEIIKLAESPSIKVNLGQGVPDFAGSQVALNKARQVLKDDVMLNQYTPVPGIPGLLNALADLWNQEGKSKMDPVQNVVCTTSATEALYIAMQAIVDPGDEVIMFEPFFPWYLPAVRLAGGTPVVMTLEAPTFAINFDKLRSAVSNKTKAIMVNSPHNPTGHMLSQEEAKELSKFCCDHDLICVSDEVYDRFIFNSAKKHIRIADEIGMEQRTVTIGSASKMFSLTGWRVGWMYGPEELVRACRTMHAFSTYCAPSPLQAGVAAAVQDWIHGTEVRNEITELSNMFRNNAERLADALSKWNVECFVPDSGYFLVCDVQKTGKTDMEFSKWMASEFGIVCVPMTCFQDSASASDKMVRFAICKKRETVEKAVAILNEKSNKV